MNPKLYNRNIRFFAAPESGDGGGGAGSSESEQDSTSTDAGTDAESQNGDTDAESQNGDTGSDENALPEWARDELKRVRSEAAKYRTQRNELRTKLEGAKSPEEIESIVSDYNEKVQGLELELTREKVARKHKLPDELAARLRGSTEEELAEDAKTLVKYARPSREPSDDPSGGLDPSDKKDTFDPKKAADEVLNRNW